MLKLGVLLIDRNALSHFNARAVVVRRLLLLHWRLVRVVVVLGLLLPLIKSRTWLLGLIYG